MNKKLCEMRNIWNTYCRRPLNLICLHCFCYLLHVYSKLSLSFYFFNFLVSLVASSHSYSLRELGKSTRNRTIKIISLTYMYVKEHTCKYPSNFTHRHHWLPLIEGLLHYYKIVSETIKYKLPITRASTNTLTYGKRDAKSFQKMIAVLLVFIIISLVYVDASHVHA